jgi:hypothetical protein
MEKFEFKSAICTTREQSEKLLALGLKKETADMVHQSIGTTPFNVWNKHEIKEDFYPAWSLHRLIEMIDYPSNIDAIKELLAAKTMFNNRLYDRVINIIEYLIRNNNFNQDYLEEKK